MHLLSAGVIWSLWRSNDTLTGVTYQTSCISGIYIAIHNSREIMKEQWNNFMVGVTTTRGGTRLGRLRTAALVCAWGPSCISFLVISLGDDKSWGNCGLEKPFTSQKKPGSQQPPSESAHQLFNHVAINYNFPRAHFFLEFSPRYQFHFIRPVPAKNRKRLWLYLNRSISRKKVKDQSGKSYYSIRPRRLYQPVLLIFQVTLRHHWGWHW